MAQKEFHPFWSERYWNIHNWRDTGTLQEADTRWNHFLKGLWRYADAIDSIVAFRHCVYGFLPVTLTPPRMCTRRPCWDFTCFFAAYTAYRDRKCVSRKWFFMFCQFQGCFFCNLRLAIEIYPATRSSSSGPKTSVDSKAILHFKVGLHGFRIPQQLTKISRHFVVYKKRHLPGISMTVRYYERSCEIGWYGW